MKRIVIMCLVVAFALSICACVDSTPENNGATNSNASQTQSVSNMTVGQENALKKAKSYLDTMAFSKKGLVEQLEFEGFSTEDSTFAVENCGADWKEQAAKKAKSYMDLMAFSRDGLIEQLEFEGFTTEEAEYGATSVGY